jgi:hypothetical protein
MIIEYGIKYFKTYDLNRKEIRLVGKVRLIPTTGGHETLLGKGKGGKVLVVHPRVYLTNGQGETQTMILDGKRWRKARASAPPAD